MKPRATENQTVLPSDYIELWTECNRLRAAIVTITLIIADALQADNPRFDMSISLQF